MAPRLIEVPADQKDFAEDVLKSMVILGTGFLLNSYVFSSPQPLAASQNLVMALIAGLALHYFVVDRQVRFVVKEGQEGYYYSKKRFA